MTFSSAVYWEERYAAGGNSGEGSRGESARFKADFLNAFVKEHGVETVVEFGCGDGEQLALVEYPQYVGVDAAREAVFICRHRFKDDATKAFYELPRFPAEHGSYDLSMSLDVIYHLVEDDVYEQHLRDVFGASSKWVILYTSDLGAGATNEGTADHVLHRRVDDDVWDRFDETWLLVQDVEGMDGCWFYVYERTA